MAAAIRSQRDSVLPPSYSRRFWSIAGVAMAALGINKPLDLQTLLTELGRAAAIHLGLFAHRRIIQAIFVAGVGGMGMIVLAWLLRRQQQMRPAVRLATLGLSCIAGYVVLRAASFHHVGLSVEQSHAAAWLLPIIELTGIVLVGAAGAVHSMSTRRSGCCSEAEDAGV